MNAHIGRRKIRHFRETNVRQSCSPRAETGNKGACQASWATAPWASCTAAERADIIPKLSEISAFAEFQANTSRVIPIFELQRA